MYYFEETEVEGGLIQIEDLIGGRKWVFDPSNIAAKREARERAAEYQRDLLAKIPVPVDYYTIDQLPALAAKRSLI